jgi:hypothetical protein
MVDIARREVDFPNHSLFQDVFELSINLNAEDELKIRLIIAAETMSEFRQGIERVEIC